MLNSIENKNMKSNDVDFNKNVIDMLCKLNDRRLDLKYKKV